MAPHREGIHHKLTLPQRQWYRERIAAWDNLVKTFQLAIDRDEQAPFYVRQEIFKACGTVDREGQFDYVLTKYDEKMTDYRARLCIDARTSLSHFAEYMNMEEWPAPHHEFICERMEMIERREIMRMILSMPPGHGKSVYCSHLFPAWYIGRRPNDKYIQAGHTQDFVEKEFGLRVKTIIESDEYKDVFPNIEISSSSKASGAWNLKKFRGRYIAKGIGQGISGYRGNICALDDPYAKRQDAESPAMRKAVYDWFMSDLTRRMLPRSPLFIVATRWHPLDLCGTLETNSKKGIGAPWNIINLPAISEDDDDPMHRPVFTGDLEAYHKLTPEEQKRAQRAALWPDFYTLEWLLEQKAELPPRDWNSLYRGKPVDENGGVLNGSWLKRYDNLPANVTNDHGMILTQNIKRITLSVDCAAKTGERNDFTVMTVWIEDTNNIHYLAQVYRDRWQFDPMVEAINAAATKWRVNAILVEDKGSGTQYIQTQGSNAPAPVIGISTNNDSKGFRFDGVTPMFQAGEVLLPLAAGWLADYESELLSFPGGAHDDQVDSTSQYLAWARRKRSLGTKKLSMGGTDGNNQIRRNDSQVAAPTADGAWMHVRMDQDALRTSVGRVKTMAGKWHGGNRAIVSTPSPPIDGGVQFRKTLANRTRDDLRLQDGPRRDAQRAHRGIISPPVVPVNQN